LPAKVSRHLVCAALHPLHPVRRPSTQEHHLPSLKDQQHEPHTHLVHISSCPGFKPGGPQPGCLLSPCEDRRHRQSAPSARGQPYPTLTLQFFNSDVACPLAKTRHTNLTLTSFTSYPALISNPEALNLGAFSPLARIDDADNQLPQLAVSSIQLSDSKSSNRTPPALLRRPTALSTTRAPCGAKDQKHPLGRCQTTNSLYPTPGGT